MTAPLLFLFARAVSFRTVGSILLLGGGARYLCMSQSRVKNQNSGAPAPFTRRSHPFHSLPVRDGSRVRARV